MKIIDRWIVASVVRHFASALAALVAIFAVISLTEELRDTAAPGWGVGAALWFVVLTLPNQAYDLFPAATLLGAVLALGRMASDHELTALQAAGVSQRRLTLAVLGAAGLLAVAGVGLGEMIAVPLSQRAHAQRALAFTGGRALSTTSGLWLRDHARFVNVGELRRDGSLGELYFFDFDERHALRRFTHARSAENVGGEWRLHDVRESTFHHDVSDNRDLATAEWSTDVELPQLRALWLEPADLSLGELRRAIRGLRARGQNPLGYEVAFWRRITAPVYMGLMVLLAVPLVMVSGRTVRVGERVLLGALVALGFQMFQRTFASAGLVAGLPAIVTALVPALVALAGAGALFRRQRAQ